MKQSDDRHTVIRQMISDGATYQAIGIHFGISRERVRQIAEQIGAGNLRKKVRREAKAEKLLAIGKADATASKTGLSLDRLRELLEYDRHTGLWRWRVSRGPARAGDIAGTENDEGYIQIRVDGELYMAHVLAWFYSFEQWPKNQIDHGDRTRNHNWLNNLRQATGAQNLGNSEKRKHNTSGFKGVYRSGNKWRAEIAHIKLGYFDTPEEASAAYNEAAKTRYGQFAIAS